MTASLTDTRSPSSGLLRLLRGPDAKSLLVPMLGYPYPPPSPLSPLAHPPYQTAALLYDHDAPARPLERRHAGRKYCAPDS
ncbi:hypothetical protein [Insolitispirillum peregrinum]|uniref:hypothetical protein n=1 Tax=Insolitispirillum peregrinum TaxID=80876 RepID=UPI00361B03BE